jgi:hypothetical protein
VAVVEMVARLIMAEEDGFNMYEELKNKSTLHCKVLLFFTGSNG